MSTNPIKLGTLARVMAMTPSEGLLAVARERAPDPSVFDDRAPFFWQVRASSNRLDFYDTRMRAGKGKTLDNFARGLSEGVSCQDSHKTNQNPWGQSLTGRILTTDEHDPAIDEKIVEVWGELFTIPGLILAGQPTDSIIDAIRSGVWRDVSVGFHARDVECSICGQQSFEWWKEDGCQHIPGYEYTFEGRTASAFAWINDGELIELSQVYKGASPAAAVLKAEQMATEGRLSEGERAFIARRHGVRIATPERTWALGEVSNRKEAPVPNDQNPISDTTRAKITEALKWGSERKLFAFDPEHDPVGEGVYRAVRKLGEFQDTIAELAADIATREVEEAKLNERIAELEPMANDGKRYRDDLISDALTAGARAHGKDFREDMYRGLLEKADIEQIRGIRDDFTKAGDEVYARRLTVEDDETATPAPAPVATDAERFRS